MARSMRTKSFSSASTMLARVMRVMLAKAPNDNTSAGINRWRSDT